MDIKHHERRHVIIVSGRKVYVKKTKQPTKIKSLIKNEKLSTTKMIIPNDNCFKNNNKSKRQSQKKKSKTRKNE